MTGGRGTLTPVLSRKRERRQARAWPLLTMLLACASVSAAAARPAASQLPDAAAAPSSRPSGGPAAARAEANAARVRAVFDAWRAGTGSVFDLLHENVVWTVAGSGPVSDTYTSRRDFLERAVQPVTSRLASPIAPEMKRVISQGDTVVVWWDGTATTRDGGSYRNSYAWHMVLKEGQVVCVTAFLDTWALQALLDE